MIEDVTNVVSQLKGLLNKYPDKTLEILQYVFGKDTLEEIANKSISEENTTIFIDTQDMEERYGEELYKEYLENKNQQLKEVIDEVREYINNPDFIDWHLGVDEGLFRRKDLLQILDKVDKNRVY